MIGADTGNLNAVTEVIRVFILQTQKTAEIKVLTNLEANYVANAVFLAYYN